MFELNEVAWLPSAYAAFVDTVLLKGTVTVLLAFLACAFLRQASAAARHGVWAAAFVVLALLPVLSFAAPASEVTVVGLRAPSPAWPTEIATPSAIAPAGNPRPDVRLPAVSVATPAPTASRPVTTFDLTIAYPWIVGAWFAGLLVQVGRLGSRFTALRRLRVRARAAPGPLASRVDALAAELGMRRPPTAIVSADVMVPSTFGVLRPVVVLPADVDSWSEDQLTAAVLHELGHLRRHDYATHLIASTVQAIYWVNPAVAYAGHRLDLERERACDDGVVSGRIDPIRYAEYLMGLAWRGRGRRQPALSFANRSSLPERVRSLLDRAQPRAPLGGASFAAIVAVTALALVPAAAIQVVGIVQDRSHEAGLADNDPIVRRHAAWALGEAEDPYAVEALIEALLDPDPRVRAVAAWSLGEIKDLRALESLELALRDDDPGVREMAVLAIGELEHPAGRAALAAADEYVASHAARAWALRQIERTGETEVFAGSLSGANPNAAEQSNYVAQLGHPDPDVRALAAEQLGILGSPDAVEPLLDALDDDSPAVRAAVVWALDEINPSDRPRGR